MTSDIFFKKVNHHLDQNLPFVCKAQNLSLKAYLQKDDDLVEVDDFNSSGFVFCPFSSAEKSIIFPASKTKVIESELEKEKVEVRSHFINETLEARKHHIGLVEKAIDYIKSGQADKIVCSRKIKVEKQINPIVTFKTLANLYPDVFSYCWYHPQVGLWIGATPERFINLDRTILKTVALAGTQDISEFAEPKWRDKEKEEQQMVTDFIVDALGDYSNSIEVENAESIRAGNLWHLKSKISAKIQAENLSEIIKELHPTSAVCGLPKSEAKSFILIQEHYNREYYSGFLGELNVKSSIQRRKKSLNQEQLAIKSIKTISDLYVNLRCMKVSEDFVEIYVGGGITIDSQPEAEYLETIAKSQTLLNVL